jgi:DNA-binding transcriptional ArsR family regulator
MDENLVDVAGRREAILDLLRDGPAAKRDVIDATGRSRSTVDRAIESLVDAGLVVARDGGYETTCAGVLALEARRAYESEARAIAEAAPALEPLWKETPISRSFVRAASVLLVETSRTADAQTRLQRAVENAGAVRLALSTVPGEAFLQSLEETAVEAGVPVTLVYDAELFEAVARERPSWLRRLVLDGEARVQTGEVPEFGLLLTDGPDGRAATLQTYDEGRLHAVLQADADPAVLWADETIDGLVEAATDATERIRRLPAEPIDGPASPGPVVAGRTATAQASESAGDADGFLDGGFGVDHGRLRTPAFGADGSCTVALWFASDGFDTDWETLVKWDYLALGYRRGWLYGHVFDPEADVKRARTTVSADRVRAGEWHHLAYTYDESVARLYLDGVVVDETADDYPLTTRPIGAAVGYLYEDRDAGVHDPTFEGRITDARFYERALDPETVRSLYRGTRP